MYGGIGLGSNMCKTFTSVLNSRLITWPDENNVVSVVHRWQISKDFTVPFLISKNHLTLLICLNFGIRFV